MTSSWRRAARVAVAAVALLGAAACKKQEGGQQGQQQSGSSGSSAQASSGSSDRQGQASGSARQQASSSKERTVQGTIVRAGQDEVVIRQGTGGEQPDLRLGVGPDTQVTMGGQQRPVADLQEGTQVRASYDESNGAPRATRIEATGGGSQPQR